MKQIHQKTLKTLQQEATECLTQNILPFWLNNMQDTDLGGWYGRRRNRERCTPWCHTLCPTVMDFQCGVSRFGWKRVVGCGSNDQSNRA